MRLSTTYHYHIMLVVSVVACLERSYCWAFISTKAMRKCLLSVRKKYRIQHQNKIDDNQLLFDIPSTSMSLHSNSNTGSPYLNEDSSSMIDPFTHDEQIELSSGVSAQVLSCKRKKQQADQKSSSLSSSNNQQEQTQQTKTTTQPPLVFLHGSFHGAWCWAENFFPYFVNRGYPVTALSWRGTSGTFAGEDVTKVKISEHVDDLESFLDQIDTILNLNDDATDAKETRTDNRPILISHSFGGLAIMKYLEKCQDNATLLSKIRGAVIMCSVPPSGNGKMTMRFLKRSIPQSWKITKGLAMKKCITDKSLCRELFFGGTKSGDDFGLSDEDIERYQSYFARDTDATIDLLDLAKKLPSLQATEDGKAPFLSSSSCPSFLVIGATDDFIVDREGLDETAKYFGLDNPVIVDSPHDVMLGKKWQNTAIALDEWVQDLLSV